MVGKNDTSSVDFSTQVVLHTEWTSSVSPAVVDGEIYVSDPTGVVEAIHYQTGDVIWTTGVNQTIDTSPIVVGEHLLVGLIDGQLLKINRSDGNIEDQTTIGSELRTVPTSFQDTLYVGTKDKEIVSVDIVSGDVEWEYESIRDVVSRPVVVDGKVFFSCTDRTLCCLDSQTGEVDWTVGFDGEVVASPTVFDGTVYVGSVDGSVYAIDVDTGLREWTFDTKSWIRTSPTIAGGFVYVGSGDRYVYALDSEYGYPIWSFETGDVIRSSPTVVGHTLFVGSDDQYLYALDSVTGRHKSRHKTPNGVRSPIVVADGTLYFTDENIDICVVDVGSGSSNGSRIRNSRAWYRGRPEHTHQPVESYLEAAKSAIGTAEDANTTDDVDQERMALLRGVFEYNRAKERAILDRNPSRRESIDSVTKVIREKVFSLCRQEAYEFVVDKVNEAVDIRESAEEHLSEGMFQLARSDFQKAENKFTIAYLKAKRYDIDTIPEVSMEIEDLSTNRRKCRLYQFWVRVSRAEHHLERDRPLRAIEICTEVLGDVGKLSEGSCDSIHSLRNKAQRTIVEASIKKNEESIQKANERLEATEYEVAINCFEQIVDGLEYTREVAESYQLSELMSRIDVYLELCNFNIEAAKYAVKSGVEVGDIELKRLSDVDI